LDGKNIRIGTKRFTITVKILKEINEEINRKIGKRTN
jgi:hypothetical protein